jgi:hypothetical protein
MGLVRVGVANPTANTATTLFTSDNQYLMSVIATNKSSSINTSLRIWVQPSGSSTESEYAYMIYDLPLDFSNSYESFRFAVNQNDVVRVSASTSNVSFSAYGLIQYDVKIGAGVSSYLNSAPANPVDGMIWVDADGVISGSASKPAYVYSAASAQWVPLAGGSLDTSANYTFTGTVIIPGYEKEIPLQSSAPISPATSDLWIDSTNAVKPILKVYNGTVWIVAGSSIESDEDQIVLSTRMFMS